MKTFLPKALTILLLVLSAGLSVLTNTGLLSIGKPYIYQASADRTTSEPVIVIENASVIPMDEERVLAEQTVIIRDGLIEQVGDGDQVEIPDGAVVIDGRGEIPDARFGGHARPHPVSERHAAAGRQWRDQRSQYVGQHRTNLLWVGFARSTGPGERDPGRTPARPHHLQRRTRHGRRAFLSSARDQHRIPGASCEPPSPGRSSRATTSSRSTTTCHRRSTPQSWKPPLNTAFPSSGMSPLPSAWTGFWQAASKRSNI